MNKKLLISLFLALAASSFAAESLCLAPVEASGISEESQNGAAGLFKIYVENQGKYQIADGSTPCENTASINISKLGQATVVNAKVVDSEKAVVWTNQQKVLKEENLDKALQKIAEELNIPAKKSTTQAPAPTEASEKKVAVKADPTLPVVPPQPKKPREISVYFGLGLGLTKFIGDEMNKLTDHEPLTMYDFFFAYDSKNLITMLNLDFSYKNNSFEVECGSYSYSNVCRDEIETNYFSWGVSFYYPIITGSITPYLGLGMAATNFSTSQDRSYDYEVEDNGLQAHVGAGILMNRNKRVNMWIHGEYFFNTYEPLDHTFHGFNMSMRVSLGV